jgi:hypothetical protein
MKPEQLLNDLGLTMGLPDLKFNEQGCARLVFDSKTAVNLESDADTGQLQIYTDLCPLPPEGREALYLSLLEGNLFGLQTQGATLAVDSANHQVVLCRTLVAEELSANAFLAIIESFVNCAEQWRAQIEGGGQQPPAPVQQTLTVPSQFQGFIRG